MINENEALEYLRKKHQLTDDVKIYFCEHILKDGRNHGFLWAGDTVRICLCRLCQSMALGTIVGERIAEVFREKYHEK